MIAPWFQNIEYVWSGDASGLATSGKSWSLPACAQPDAAKVQRIAELFGVQGDLRTHAIHESLRYCDMVLAQSPGNAQLNLRRGRLLHAQGLDRIICEKLRIEAKPADMKVGEDSKSTVREKLGSPSAVSTFDSNAWYYISQTTDRVAFYKPRVIKRDVVAINNGRAVFAGPGDGVAR